MIIVKQSKSRMRKPYQGVRYLRHPHSFNLFLLLSVSEKAYEAKAMAEQGVAMAKDKCKVQ